MSEPITINPCPFCGGTARATRKPLGWDIECCKCNANMFDVRYVDDSWESCLDRIITTWNHRVSLANVSEATS